MTSKSRILLLLTLIGLLHACDPEAERRGAPISREQFIETNLSLRQIDPSAEDAQQRREEVLRQHQVTEEELQGFVTAYADDTEALARIWEEIHRRLAEQEAGGEQEVVEEGEATEPG